MRFEVYIKRSTHGMPGMRGLTVRLQEAPSHVPVRIVQCLFAAKSLANIRTMDVTFKYDLMYEGIDHRQFGAVVARVSLP